MRKDKTTLPQRRRFIKGVFATGGVLALGMSAGSGNADNTPQTSAATADPKGYRLSDHIQAYYQTLRV